MNKNWRMKRIASDWTEMWETTFHQAVSVGCGNMQYVVYKLRRYIIYDYFSLLFTLQSFIIISLFFATCNYFVCFTWLLLAADIDVIYVNLYTQHFHRWKKLNFIVIAFHSHNEIFSHRLSYSSVLCVLIIFFFGVWNRSRKGKVVVW